MNRCRKCDSDYEQPGTCNCYAQIAKPPVVYPTISPAIPPEYPWGPSIAPYQPSPWWGVHEYPRIIYPRISYTTTTAPVMT